MRKKFQLTGRPDVNTANIGSVEVFGYKTLAATDIEANQDLQLSPPTSQDVAIIM
jgi:hypothetical protein